jgi:hypothetical protein
LQHLGRPHGHLPPAERHVGETVTFARGVPLAAPDHQAAGGNAAHHGKKGRKGTAPCGAARASACTLPTTP